jgi:cobalt-zinc-cadmium efflux system membrane fusion protein
MSRVALRTLVFVVALSRIACRRAPPDVEAEQTHARARRDEAVELTPAGMVNSQIRVERITTETFAPRVRIPAEIQADPDRLAHIGARTPGRVVALVVRPGDVLHRGDAIAEIDTVELHQVSMEFLTAVARARQANDALARQQQLVRERIGAEADLRRAEADAAAASAALREGEEHLHFLGLTDREIAQLRARTSHGEARSTVRAPIDGRVENVNVSIGQVVSGTEDIATVAQLETVWAVLRVYERDAANVQVGTSVDVTTVGTGDQHFTGRVGFVSSLVDPVTRTFTARVALENPGLVLRPGMSATASVTVHETQEHLWLPVEAVQPHEGESIAFVQVGERRFAPRVVRVGEERNGFVPVLEGLRIGESVVTRGAFALRGELERSAFDEE